MSPAHFLTTDWAACCTQEVVNYTMASTAALQVGDVSSYVLSATGALQLTTSHPQRPFHTLVNDDQAVLVALSETLFLIFFQVSRHVDLTAPSSELARSLSSLPPYSSYR